MGDSTELTEELKHVQHKSYLDKCLYLEENILVGQVDQHVRTLMVEWVSSRLNGLNEETRASIQKIIGSSIVWTHFSKHIADGRTDVDAVDFEERSRHINSKHLAATVWVDCEPPAFSSYLRILTGEEGQRGDLAGQEDDGQGAGDIVAC